MSAPQMDQERAKALRSKPGKDSVFNLIGGKHQLSTSVQI